MQSTTLFTHVGVAFCAGCAWGPSLTFANPDEAVLALVDASENQALAEQLLGDGGFDMLQSGDDVADRQDIEAVTAMIKKKVRFEDDGDGRQIAVLGDAGWELPIPLVENGGRWSFDVEAGKDEILNRRVGRTELNTSETLRAIVEAQREYASVPRDGDQRAFAQKSFQEMERHPQRVAGQGQQARRCRQTHRRATSRS
jgi:hypothetical protein